MVKKGEPIMLIGSTGNSTGAHLHFEVRIGGSGYSNTVDPIGYITTNKEVETKEEKPNQNINNRGEDNTIIID